MVKSKTKKDRQDLSFLLENLVLFDTILTPFFVNFEHLSAKKQRGFLRYKKNFGKPYACNQTTDFDSFVHSIHDIVVK